MAEQTNDDQILHRLYEQVSKHLETRLEYFTLSSTEKMSGLAANVAGAISFFIFLVLVLFFFTFGFAWWLGDRIGDRAIGFVMTGLIFIPIALIFFWWVRPFVRRKIIQSIFHDKTSSQTYEDPR
jgi:hypothetical protein